MTRLVCFFVLIILLAACTSREQGVEGQLLFQGQPLAAAQLEVYLKSGQERSSSPFAQVSTDAAGRYRVALPQGSYFLVGKMKQQGGGVNRMLMAEALSNPYPVDGKMVSVPPFELQEMGHGGNLTPDPQTWVEGRLTSGAEALSDAFVYVYTQDSEDLIGPSYAKVVQADARGDFRIELPAGRFWLAARKRADGARSGKPEAGDLNGSYAGNPVDIARGQQLQLGVFALNPISADKFKQRMESGTFTPTDSSISGRAVDEKGKPLKGIYVYAYSDSRMIGKPAHISVPTGADGRFDLYLGGQGQFFIGARSTFGGPLEPGEWVGTYEGRADHGLHIDGGRRTSVGDIVLREIW